MENFENNFQNPIGENPEEKPDFFDGATPEEEKLIFAASIEAVLKAERGDYSKEEYDSNGERRIRVKNKEGELLLDYSQEEYFALKEEAKNSRKE